MKATKIWFFLVIVMTFIGCKATKTVVESSSETEKREQAVVSNKAEESTQIVRTITYDEQGGYSDNLTEKIVEETYSAPDSTGKQHITSRRTTDRNKGKTETRTIKQDSEQFEKNYLSSSAEAKLEAKTTDNQDTKETAKTTVKTPAAVRMAMPILVIAIIGLILAYVNRKRILRWICTRLLKK